MNTIEWHPGRLLEISGFYWQTCTLHAAVKLDLFTVLSDGPMSAEAVAVETGADPDGTARLLNALAAMQLLRKDGDRYHPVPSASRLLSSESPDYIGHIIMHHHHLMGSWWRLDEAVKTGLPVREPASANDPDRRKSFLMGMFNLAMQIAPVLTSAVDLSACRHLLDLGGGPGTYAIHFCRRYPQLRATVFDLPTTHPFAEKTIAEFNLSNRIEFIEGDYLADDLGDGYDAVWMSHILHGEGPSNCRRLLEKAVSSSRPGGIVIVHEFILDDTMDGPLFAALFSLNMLQGTQHGQAYSEKQIREMMLQAGISDIHRIPVKTPNDSGLLAGTIG